MSAGESAGESAEGAAGPKLGAYYGKTKDYTCPGDHVTWEIVLAGGEQASLECIPEMSYFKGGQPPWHADGTWEWDADESEVVLTVTKPDAIGPRKDADIKIPVAEDGSLSYKGSRCVWRGPPPPPPASKLSKMTLKELKLAMVALGLNPEGCVERADFEERLKGKKIEEEPVPAPVAASVDSPAADETPVEKPVAATTDIAAPADGVAKVISPAQAEKASPDPEPVADDESDCYTLEQLTDKRLWEKLDIKATDRETYLPTKVFQDLFGMPKADFAKLPKWKKDNAKKKHGLF